MALVFYAALGYKLNPGVSSILIVAGIIALTFKTFLFFVEEARLWTKKKINKLIKRIDKFLKKENQWNWLAFS